ncbi:hypothetical protein PanWU01x14_351450 [Parasponia andersonii]|uniref:Uncharacterized protein n=1 Tax=Parasponia andersonii TaxID=3476 RepID=A0A2P5AAM1_PARAD|nr:hypothetical protein PanWU01x14_351450 [Parasponia andersonii]
MAVVIFLVLGRDSESYPTFKLMFPPGVIVVIGCVVSISFRQCPRDLTTIVDFVNTFLLELQEACLPPSPVKWKASPSEGLKMSTYASLNNGIGFVGLGAV